MDVLQIGNFTFDPDDMPEEIGLGGEHMLAVIKFPGGYKEVQTFGAFDDNPMWEGTFNYNAHEKVGQIDAMWRSGHVYPITIGTLNPRYGVIKNFKWKYRNEFMIDYTIEIELTPQHSVVKPSGSNTVSTPKTNAPAPQKVHIVTGSETLFGLAKLFYNDGTQYRKISDANGHITSNDLQPGMKLVIP